MAGNMSQDLMPVEHTAVSQNAGGILQPLTIGVATEPILIGNQMTLNVENSPCSKVAGVLFEQHFHYGSASNTPTEEDQNFDNEILAEIVRSLKKFYSSKAAWFVPFEWMQEEKLPPEEYYVDLDIVKLSRSNRFVKQESVPLDNILCADSETTSAPHNVLIHGEPGIGKTTVCIQLIYDWATRTNGPFSKYPLVLFVPFRSLDTHIDDFIVDLCCKAVREKSPSQAVVKKLLKNLGSNLLLVLDSLEELPHNVEDSFFRLLTFDRSRQQSLLYEATVIVTTRPNPPMSYVEVFNRHVRINGFSHSHQGEYVEKYFKYEPEKLNCMMTELQIGTYRGLGACPLMLYILCYLHDIGEDILKTTRATDIYSTVTSLLITRSAHRESDRPNMILEQRDLEHFLIQLGHLCCNCMRDGRLYVTEGEILLIFSSPLEQKIVKGSGLIKLAKYPRKTKVDYFEPIHRSFFEFLAAKSFRFELSKVVSQERRFSLIQDNNSLLTATNSPVLIYLCGLDVGHSENQLLSLDYFQQSEQVVTTNDPLLDLKIPGKRSSAFSVVTSSLLLNEVTSQEKLTNVLELTKHYDQTPNFTSCPPFFYQGFKKFMSQNQKPISKLSYEVGYGDYTLELYALRCAQRINKLLLNFVIPFDRRQLGELDHSPFTFLRGILELDNINYLSVKVNEFWVMAFTEEVDSSFNLRNLKYVDIMGSFTWNHFLSVKTWTERYSPNFTFLSCDVLYIKCCVSDVIDTCVDVVVQKLVQEVSASSRDLKVTLWKTEQGCDVVWNVSHEEDGSVDRRGLTGDAARTEMYSFFGFEDPSCETVVQIRLIYKDVMKWEVSFCTGLKVNDRQVTDRFVSCYRTIQLEDKSLEWRGTIPVVSKDDQELMGWYEISHDQSSNKSNW